MHALIRIAVYGFLWKTRECHYEDREDDEWSHHHSLFCEHTMLGKKQIVMNQKNAQLRVAENLRV